MTYRLPTEEVFTVAGEHPADRLLHTQGVRQGSLRGDAPPTPLQVAAVMHGLADHTHLAHIVNKVVTRAGLADTDDTFNPPATSLGRYFHALGDKIELDHAAQAGVEETGWPRCSHGYGPGDHHFEAGHCHTAPTNALTDPLVSAARSVLAVFDGPEGVVAPQVTAALAELAEALRPFAKVNHG